MVKKNSMFMAAAVMSLWSAAYGAPQDLASADQVAYYSKGLNDAAMNQGGRPALRFTNPDGTTPVTGNVVVDQLTGLMWVKDGKSPGPAACGPAESKTWQAALDYVACLNAGAYLGYSDWRLSDVKELKSLVHGAPRNAAEWLNSQGFNDVQANYYWTSSEDEAYKQKALCVGMVLGGVYSGPKQYDTFYAWPVRSGQ
jgi:hypothetical protein